MPAAARRPSFDLLASSSSGDERGFSSHSTVTSFGDFEACRDVPPVPRVRRRTRRRRKAKQEQEPLCVPARSVTSATVCEAVVVAEEAEIFDSYVRVNGDCDGEEKDTRESSVEKWSLESSVSPVGDADVDFERERSLEREGSLEREPSLDWGKVMKEDPCLFGEDTSEKRSPLRYFMDEVYGGNALRSTISIGNERKRQRVYNTMFRVPLRCERLIIAGFGVCLDSFLSLLTIMPSRILIILWRLLTTRRFQRPDAATISDLGCFVVLSSGITSLHITDISLIYHIIRGQGTLKLYVVYNVLEVFDKLLQSFSQDVLQVLFSSAEGLATCSSDSLAFELMRFLLDLAITIMAFIVHAFILLAQAITLSTCIISHNNNLFALLVSNNFAEIKSNVFKKASKENLQSLVYYDVIERFHLTAFILFVLAQNILEAEGSWLSNFVFNAVLILMCEVLIDTIKHSFLAKFNEIKPSAYSDFLEDLCKQTLNIPSEGPRKDLNFIPIAPACVVIRVLAPIYAKALPFGPIYWRWFWIIIWFALTFIMLIIGKILISMSLNHLAAWYINQRREKKQKAD